MEFGFGKKITTENINDMKAFIFFLIEAIIAPAIKLQAQANKNSSCTF